MGRGVFVFDIVLIAAFAVSLYPSFTGYAVHEWLGLVVAIAMLAHVVIRVADFAKTAVAGFKAHRPGLISTAALDAATFVTLALCAVSGLLISGAVLPSMGLFADGYYIWNSLHSFSAKLLLALAVVHVVLSWPRVSAIIKAVRTGAPARTDGKKDV